MLGETDRKLPPKPLLDFDSNESDQDAKAPEVYCICRSADTKRFMIACDNCPEWFHGDCINITAKEAKRIVKFYCHPCQKKYNLKIVYGKAEPEVATKPSSSSNKRVRLSGSESDDEDSTDTDSTPTAGSSDVSSDFSGPSRHKSHKMHLKKRPPPPKMSRSTAQPSKKKTSGIAAQSSKLASQTVIPYLSGDSDIEDSNSDRMTQISSKRSKDPKDRDNVKNVSSDKRCGVCVACTLSDDCGKCDVCRGTCTSDKKICRLRRCVSVLNSTFKSSKLTRPSDNDPSNGSTTDSLDEDMSDLNSHTIDSVSVFSRSSSNYANKASKSNPAGSISKGIAKRSKQVGNAAMRKAHRTKKNNTVGRPPLSGSVAATSRAKNPTGPARKNRIVHSNFQEEPISVMVAPRQCWGPGCVEEARRLSKYCSDECGLQMAKRRLELFLPGRAETWDQTPTYLDAQDEMKLQKIEKDLSGVAQALMDKEQEIMKLNALIEKIRRMRASEDNMAVHDPNVSDSVEQMVCVTCSTEVSVKHCLRHMEKCYQKMESNTMFYASTKERMVGTPLFCDVFDSQMNAYCKRLKALCEHTKEPKISNDALCGCPLVKNVFEETGEFCLVLRRKCNRHFGWERMRRASIDMQRYKLLNRMEDLYTQRRSVEQRKSRRHHVLGLLLHKTVDHNPGIQLIPPAS